MSVTSPHRSALRTAIMAVAVCASVLQFSGCVIVQPAVSNPTSNVVRVAVAPFVNHSSEPAVDPIRFSNAYFAELQKVPGFEVVPASVTAKAIEQLQLQMAGPDDALALARALEVDAVVLGAVTDYDPYYPPRMGLHIEWYSPKRPDFRIGVPVDPFTRPEWWRERIPHGPGPHGQPRAVSEGMHGDRHGEPFYRSPMHPAAPCPAGQCPPETGGGTTSQLPLSRQPRVVRGQSPRVFGHANANHVRPAMREVVTSSRPRGLIRPGTSSSSARDRVELLRPPPDESEYRLATFVNPLVPTATWDDNANPGEDLSLDDLPPSPPPVDRRLGDPDPHSVFELPLSDDGSSSTPPTSDRRLGDPRPVPLFNEDVLPSRPSPFDPVLDPAQEPIPEFNSPSEPPRFPGPPPRFPSPPPPEPSVEANPFPEPAPRAEPAPIPNTRTDAVPTPRAPESRESFGPWPRPRSGSPWPNAAEQAPSVDVPSPHRRPQSMRTLPLHPAVVPQPDPHCCPPPVAVPAGTADGPAPILPPAPPIGFDPREPIMSYTRVFDGRDSDLLARLRDYHALSGDQRSGGWEAYLHRSEDFIRFTSYVMISEMLTLHGGETKRRYVMKLRKRE